MAFTRTFITCYTGAALALAFAAGCGTDSGAPGPGSGSGQILQHASRSSTVAVSDDGARVAMVNPEDGSLSVFDTTSDMLLSKTATGTTPANVVLTADGKTAYVSNRGDATVVAVTGLDTATPAIASTVAVGAEPIGLALSPTGASLFVAEFAESRVSVIDTATMKISSTIPMDRPRALLVTNNLSGNDAAETLIAPSFFGAPVPGQESLDTGRTGNVQLVSLGNLSQVKTVTLGSIDSGFAQGDVTGNPTVHASPNQLGAVAFAKGRVYITAVEASPEGPTRFDNNVFPVVHVADFAAQTEVTDGTGTFDVARTIYDTVTSPSPTAPRFIPGDLSDIAFVDNSEVAYVIGRAGDVMVRIAFGSGAPTIGSTQNQEIDLGGNATIGQCQGPTGMAIDSASSKVYVNCWITRRLGIVDLASQSLTSTVVSAPLPSDPAGQSVQRGKRFFFTGRGRWSAAVANGAVGGEGWEACSSCHADGLTDNVTWSFQAGPRQTTSLDGTFSHDNNAPKQRMLNWTAINDELHDFERNTRNVSGGLGAIVTAPTPSDCGHLDQEIAVPLTVDGTGSGTPIGGLGKPLKEIADDIAVATCGNHNWDDINNYVQTIQPPRALRTLDPAAVTRGQQVFADGHCADCHGGAGWTVSRLYYAPSSAENAALGSASYAPPAFFPTTWTYSNVGQDRFQISAQPPVPTDATGPGDATPVPIGEAACALRNVGTFGVPGNAAATTALEIRLAAGSAVPSEGRAGYNVPALYGLSLGAPYLHHGGSPSLTDLFSNPAWGFHTNSANANFSVELGQSTNTSDLVAFLLSIDATTPEVQIPSDPATQISFDACPPQ
jgi:DNA-binding beta-propeller fold protein YncE